VNELDLLNLDHSKTFLCVTNNISYVPYYLTAIMHIRLEKINKRINEPKSMSRLYHAIIAFSINLKYSERINRINSKDTTFRIYLYKCKCKIRRDSLLKFIHQSFSFTSNIFSLFFFIIFIISLLLFFTNHIFCILSHFYLF